MSHGKMAGIRGTFACACAAVRGSDSNSAPAPLDPQGMLNMNVFQSMTNALLCLDNNKTAAVCPRGGHLNETGIIPHFSKADVELYCTGGCANQTQSKCMYNTYGRFRFNNNALTTNVRNTVKAACDPHSIMHGDFTIIGTGFGTSLARSWALISVAMVSIAALQ